MDLPAESDVLAQATRARIFRELVRNRAAIGTEELARRLDLHPNGVRRHMERLREAGLVERSRSRGGRGRPSDRWSVAPKGRPGGEAPSAYGDLSRWLVRAMPATRGRLREVEKTGRQIGRELAPGKSADPVADFGAVVAALGFQPAIEPKGDGGFSCRLGNCPYRDSVRESQEVVCGLHRGLTAGLLDKLDPAAKLARFEPHDPERAGCLVEVTR